MSKSDVVVIGNGVAGLVSALVSANQGQKVTSFPMVLVHSL